jgi:hypothetical protein
MIDREVKVGRYVISSPMTQDALFGRQYTITGLESHGGRLIVKGSDAGGKGHLLYNYALICDTAQELKTLSDLNEQHREILRGVQKLFDGMVLSLQKGASIEVPLARAQRIHAELS